MVWTSAKKHFNRFLLLYFVYLLFYFFICLSVIYYVNYFTYFRWPVICYIKTRPDAKFSIVPEEGWFGQPKYSTRSKKHSTLCRFLPLYSYLVWMFPTVQYLGVILKSWMWSQIQCRTTWNGQGSSCRWFLFTKRNHNGDFLSFYLELEQPFISLTAKGKFSNR